MSKIVGSNGFGCRDEGKNSEGAPYIRDRLTFLRILKYYNFYDKVIK